MGEHIVIYDGNCGLCRACVRWLLARGAPVRPVDYHDPLGFSGLGISFAAADRSVYLLSPGGRVEQGYTAVVGLLRLVRGWRRLAPILKFWPVRLVGAAIYQFVTSHRHGISRLLGLERVPRVA